MVRTNLRIACVFLDQQLIIEHYGTGVFEMPQGVGRSAERALRGCMERSVPNRWTVAMVDEVAWGIGWGSAADDVTPPSEDVPCTTSRSPSRSRVNLCTEQPVERGSNRSTSRLARSSSRSTSAVRTSSRSKSRAPHYPYDRDAATPPYHHPLLQTDTHPAHPLPTQPSFSSLTSAILRASSVSSSHSSSSGPHDSAIILQSSLSRESDVTGVLQRGRMPRPRCPTVDASVSRSQSPNEPATPRDRSVDLLRRHKSPLPRPSLSTPDLEHQVSELDALEEDGRWALSPHSESDLAARSLSRYGDEEHSRSRSRSQARGRAFSRSRDELRKVMRNGSMPPALSPTRPSAWTHTHTPSAVKGSATGAVTPATPIPIPGAAQATRSKSLGV